MLVSATDTEIEFEFRSISNSLIDTYSIDLTGKTITGTNADNVVAPTANVLALRTTSRNDTISTLAGDDTIDGGGGDDTLSGGSGNDLMSGSAGDDTVNGGSGDDTVNGGSGHDRVYGGAGRDAVSGGIGNDTVSGGAGNDTLSGNGGRDVFLFDTRLSKSSNVDTIKDFNVASDSLWLDNSVFTQLGRGSPKGVKLAADLFVSASGAQDTQDRIIYDQETGSLYYDRDGTGSAAQVKFATLTNKAKLSFHDFFVI
jgi:Ca2+-binding RTX toxin-like protein